MIPFDYRRADDARGAVAERPDAVFLGAGTNLVDHMKLGVADPGLVVDVSRLPFGAIEPLERGGVRIGATVRNSDLAAEPMTMGVSMALHEHSVMDPRFGQVANHDFAGYHIAANADIGSIDAIWVEEDDPHVNPMGLQGDRRDRNRRDRGGHRQRGPPRDRDPHPRPAAHSRQVPPLIFLL